MRSVQYAYISCLAPRVLGGALPTQPGVTVANSRILTFGLVIVGISAVLSAACFALSFITNRPCYTAMRRLVSLPLLFWFCVSLIFCFASISVTATAFPCGPVDLVGRYVVALVITLPFLVAAAMVFPLLMLQEKCQISGEEEDRGARAGVLHPLPNSLIQPALLTILVAYFSAQGVAYAQADPDYTFHPTSCAAESPAHPAPIIRYMEREHIHYAWATLTNPGNDWLFAEGHVDAHFQENLVLANFSQNSVVATVKLEHTNNQVQVYQVTVNSESQATFDVNWAFNQCSHSSNPCSGDISAEVITQTGPIVAERVMYFHYSGESGETDVVGQAGPASQTTYSFAEGNAIGTFHEYLTLQNPMGNTATVAVRLFFNHTVIEQVLNLPVYSRTTIDVNSLIDPIVRAYAPHDAEVSVVVQSFTGPIMVERPLYFTFFPGGHYANATGGTDVIGYTGN